ncbi:DUF2076 domain-containing protein [Lichenibacterium ramalinae]|uniref:DUF2076 domain-containing protein n=1 Tax=Lichenibacterium ramalinae TaxID=2316527 RepID=A0A4Q2RDV1_9HYPH|nr:DUF2076 domain-containing protein [Lichenibacterium ramalinae]RYB05087.1 DUF2076 domain-containing protein [Lichenibacterium ramalinae]
MNSDERQLITGLFDRMKSVGSQGRDRDADQLITDQVRQQPYAPYLLTQTVLVQDQALRAANDRIQQLEEQVRQTQAPGQQNEGGFLGGLGRMFGGGAAGAAASSVPSTGHAAQPDPYRGQQPGYGQQQGYGQQPGYGQQQPPQGPWGNQGYAQQQPQGGGMFGGGGGGGGGFMKGALGAAAGVAGGVLMADGIRNLFSGGHNPMGIASGFGGGEGGFGAPGGETVINNYYDSPQDQQPSDNQGGGYQAGNYGNDGGGDTGGGDPGGYSQDV